MQLTSEGGAGQDFQRGARRHGEEDQLWRMAGALPVLTTSFLSKLSVPPFGAAGLSLAIPLLSSVSALCLLTGRMVVDAPRFVAYACMVSLLWGMQVMRGESFSVASLFMMTVLHFPYILRLDPIPDYEKVIAWFQKVAVAIACLGIAQFAMQFLIGAKLAFPIENYFPASFKTSMFNAQGYLEYGSPYYRTNGIFMQEPSFFSQLIAVAIVVELMTRLRWRVLLILAAAIIVSYSGTGLMLLAVCLPLFIIAKGRLDVLVVGAIVFIVAIVVASAAEVVFVRVFLSRAREFNATGSSGFARFVGGFYLFEQFLWPDFLRALFGFGAGSLDDYAKKANMPSGGNVVFKMLFEFGLVGGLSYMAFLGFCIYRSAAPWLIKIVVSLTYLLGGIYIPFAHGLVMGLVLWPFPSRRNPKHHQLTRDTP